MKREIILMGFEKFDAGTKSPLLGKPKLITFPDEICNRAHRDFEVHRGCLC